MNKFKHLSFFHFTTFRSKLTFTFILTSMIPLLLSITIAMLIINSYLKKDAVNLLISDARLETQQIEEKLNQIISMQNSLSTIFSSALTLDNQTKEVSSFSLSQFESLRANVTSLEYVYDVERIRIYSDLFPFTWGDSFHFFPLDDLDSTILHQISMESHSVNRLKAIYALGKSDKSLASFYRIIKNVSGKTIGIYFIDIAVDNTLKKILSPGSSHTRVSIIDADFRVLYQSEDSMSISIDTLNNPLDKAYPTKDSKYQILKKSKYAEWYYVFESVGQNFKLVNEALRFGYLLVFSLTILLCIIAIAIFPNALSKRIKYFSTTINGISDEELASCAVTDSILSSMIKESNSMDEIDSIIASFYNLFKKNMQLYHSVKQHELEIEKSKFTILQEQINPHFLYNSLDTIRICMLMNKVDVACRLIQSLSQFYRISLSKGKDIITINQELNMIESYLEIEYAGYDGFIEWEIICDETTGTYGIPKFTLQPIVENSIVHGNFTSLDSKLFITIKAICTQNITITISDNGPGIPSEHLQVLNELLSTGKLVTSSSYGLQNCNQRIRIHYGSAYGIHLESRKNCSGTCTYINLPAVTLEG